MISVELSSLVGDEDDYQKVSLQFEGREHWGVVLRDFVRALGVVYGYDITSHEAAESLMKHGEDDE